MVKRLQRALNEGMNRQCAHARGLVGRAVPTATACRLCLLSTHQQCQSHLLLVSAPQQSAASLQEQLTQNTYCHNRFSQGMGHAGIATCGSGRTARDQARSRADRGEHAGDKTSEQLPQQHRDRTLDSCNAGSYSTKHVHTGKSYKAKHTWAL